MRSQFDLMKEILSLSKTDMSAMAEALALYDLRKAEQLKFFLETHVQDEERRRLEESLLLKAAARAEAAENKWKLGGGFV